jgi:tetratricopeptide (TPR) repeat protein
MLEGESREQFEQLNTAGQLAKQAGDHESALAIFEKADQLAIAHDDNLKRMHALTPAARALWSLDRYDEATAKLEAASEIAAELDLTDEKGITISNIGRIAAVKTVHTIPIGRQKTVLRAEAVPRFREAYKTLKGHAHLYYRYANAQHGSVISAMAGERRLTGRLIAEGVRVAFRRSEEPYDQKRTYEINPRGLVQLLAATALIPLGSRTPLLARYARNRLIR